MYAVHSIPPGLHVEAPDCDCGCLTAPHGGGRSLRGWLDEIVQADSRRLRDLLVTGTLGDGVRVAAHLVNGHAERHRTESQGTARALAWLAEGADAVLVGMSTLQSASGGGGLIVTCVTGPGPLPVLAVARHAMPTTSGGHAFGAVPRATAQHLSRSAGRRLKEIATLADRR